ncbi:MAG: DNA polymerase Y family protein, partial [Chloroflexi bacterium]|nr:DNA polymerase Y family protein [Chloroflexota bacterium]
MNTDGALTSHPRVGYLWIPHLPLRVALRRHPKVDGHPVVVGGSSTSDGVVVDATDDCLMAGVVIGQPLREAREFCPRATFLPADPAGDRRAHEAVLDLIETMAPVVEDDGLGRAYIGSRVPAADSDEDHRFLATLRTLILARLGFRARLALAPGKFAARLAVEREAGCAAGWTSPQSPMCANFGPRTAAPGADPRTVQMDCSCPCPPFLSGSDAGRGSRHPPPRVGFGSGGDDGEGGDGATVVLTGDVTTYLAPLPVEVLPLAPQALARLRLLGIRTVGQFARLPRDGLPCRFGPEAALAHALARGHDDRPVVARKRPEVRVARHEFEPAVEVAESLVAVVERLLDRLCRALRTEGKAFRSLGVTVEYEAGGSAERFVELRVATAALDHCRTTLRTLVQTVAPGGPAVGLTVMLAAIGPAGGEQLSLIDNATASGERRRRLDAATKEVARRYPARLRRVAARDLPTLLDEYHFALLPYEGGCEEGGGRSEGRRGDSPRPSLLPPPSSPRPVAPPDP